MDAPPADTGCANGDGLALVGLAIGGGAWLIEQQVQRRAELRSEVGTAVEQANSLRKQFHFHEASELLEQARQQLGTAGPDDVRRQVQQARDDLKLAEGLDTARMRGNSCGGEVRDCRSRVALC